MTPEDDRASDDAQARLALLEQHVQRAIELIGTLRAENTRLAAGAAGSRRVWRS